MNSKDAQDIKHLVEEGVKGALAEMNLTHPYEAEKARIDKLEGILEKLSILIVGNGHVEGSLVWRQTQTEQLTTRLASILDNSKLQTPPDKFSAFIRYFTDKILPPIITTGILSLFALIYAIQQHIITIP